MAVPWQTYLHRNDENEPSDGDDGDVEISAIGERKDSEKGGKKERERKKREMIQKMEEEDGKDSAEEECANKAETAKIYLLLLFAKTYFLRNYFRSKSKNIFHFRVSSFIAFGCE